MPSPFAILRPLLNFGVTPSGPNLHGRLSLPARAGRFPGPVAGFETEGGRISKSSAFRHRNLCVSTALQQRGREVHLDRCEAYRHFAAHCLELARRMDSPRDRTILLEMALLWSRLAELAVRSALLNQPANPTSPT